MPKPKLRPAQELAAILASINDEPPNYQFAYHLSITFNSRCEEFQQYIPRWYVQLFDSFNGQTILAELLDCEGPAAILNAMDPDDLLRLCFYLSATIQSELREHSTMAVQVLLKLDQTSLYTALRALLHPDRLDSFEAIQQSVSCPVITPPTFNVPPQALPLLFPTIDTTQFAPQFAWFVYLLSIYPSNTQYYDLHFRGLLDESTDLSTPTGLKPDFSIDNFVFNRLFNTYDEFLLNTLPHVLLKLKTTQAPAITTSLIAPSSNSTRINFPYFPNTHPIMLPITKKAFSTLLRRPTDQFLQYFNMMFILGPIFSTLWSSSTPSIPTSTTSTTTTTTRHRDNHDPPNEPTPPPRSPFLFNLPPTAPTTSSTSPPEPQQPQPQPTSTLLDLMIDTHDSHALSNLAPILHTPSVMFQLLSHKARAWLCETYPAPCCGEGDNDGKGAMTATTSTTLPTLDLHPLLLLKFVLHLYSPLRQRLSLLKLPTPPRKALKYLLLNARDEFPIIFHVFHRIYPNESLADFFTNHILSHLHDFIGLKHIDFSFYLYQNNKLTIHQHLYKAMCSGQMAKTQIDALHNFLIQPWVSPSQVDHRALLRHITLCVHAGFLSPPPLSPPLRPTTTSTSTTTATTPSPSNSLLQAHDSRWQSSITPLALDPHYASTYHLPTMFRSHLMGVLIAMSNLPTYFPKSTQLLAEAVFRHIPLLVENACPVLFGVNQEAILPTTVLGMCEPLTFFPHPINQAPVLNIHSVLLDDDGVLLGLRLIPDDDDDNGDDDKEEKNEADEDAENDADGNDGNDDDDDDENQDDDGPDFRGDQIDDDGDGEGENPLGRILGAWDAEFGHLELPTGYSEESDIDTALGAENDKGWNLDDDIFAEPTRHIDVLDDYYYTLARGNVARHTEWTKETTAEHRKLLRGIKQVVTTRVHISDQVAFRDIQLPLQWKTEERRVQYRHQQQLCKSALNNSQPAVQGPSISFDFNPYNKEPIDDTTQEWLYDPTNAQLMELQTTKDLKRDLLRYHQDSLKVETDIVVRVMQHVLAQAEQAGLLDGATLSCDGSTSSNKVATGPVPITASKRKAPPKRTTSTSNNNDSGHSDSNPNPNNTPKSYPFLDPDALMTPNSLSLDQSQWALELLIVGTLGIAPSGTHHQPNPLSTQPPPPHQGSTSNSTTSTSIHSQRIDYAKQRVIANMPSMLSLLQRPDRLATPSHHSRLEFFYDILLQLTLSSTLPLYNTLLTLPTTPSPPNPTPLPSPHNSHLELFDAFL